MASLAEFVEVVVSSLEKSEVPYFLTGSVASIYYSEPRTTQDLDIVVWAPKASIEAFATCFSRDRYYVGDYERAYEAGDQFNIVDTETNWKVDIMFLQPTPFDGSRCNRRKRVELFPGLHAYIPTVEDMILVKLEWAKLAESERQIRDATSMIEVNRESLDFDYLDRWAKELSIGGLLQSVLSEL